MLYWVIFPSFSCGDDCFLIDLLQSSLLGRGIFICITSHSFNDFGQDEPPEEPDLWGFDCLITYDSLVDRYLEAATVAQVDYFS